MEKIVITGDSSALDADGFANDVTALAGAALTLAATEVGDDLAHKVTITPSGSVTGNYSLTGTDADGAAITETLATNTTNAVTSAKHYLTLTQVLAPSGIGSETVDIGWNADSVSPSYAVQTVRGPQFNIGFGCDVTGGTPTYTVQQTYNGSTWFNHSSVAAETTDQEGVYTSPILALRLAWSAAGAVTLTGIQFGA